MKIHLKVIRESTTTIECKEFTCSPCTHLHARLADSWGPGKAHCDLFGELKWPKMVNEIERLPQCLKLDTPNTSPLKDGVQVLILGIEN